MKKEQFITEDIYRKCRKNVFGERAKLIWGGRRIPSYHATQLIYKIAGKGKNGFGPEDLAILWAIETNFTLFPKNNGNKASQLENIDIGPAQINYRLWKVTMDRNKRKLIFGSKLKDNQRFDGSPEKNLRWGWKRIQKKGHRGYNPNSKIRPIAVKKLKPELKKFFNCIFSNINSSNFDIEHPLVYIQQKKQNDCWLTAVTMIKGKSLLSKKVKLHSNGGLLLTEDNINTFAHEYNLKRLPMKTYTYRGLGEILRNGPLFVAGNFNRPGGHAYVIAGIRDGKILILDPRSKKGWIEYNMLVQKFPFSTAILMQKL